MNVWTWDMFVVLKKILFSYCVQQTWGTANVIKFRGREQSESFRGSEVSDWEVRKKRLKKIELLFKNVKRKNTNRRKATCVDHFYRRNKQNQNIQPLSTSLNLKFRRSLPLILQNTQWLITCSRNIIRLMHISTAFDCILVNASQCISSCRDGACLSSTHFLYRGFTACHHCLVKAVHGKRCEHTISKRSILL